MTDVRRLVIGGSYCGAQVAKAIRHGKLPRATDCLCADCGKPAIEYDHRDYNKPLDVAPVCRSCNIKRGPAIFRQWTAGEIFERMQRAAHSQHIAPWARKWCIDRIASVCKEIERWTGIPRHQLRPDLWKKSRG